MNVSEIKKLAKELQEYTRVVGSHNIHIQEIANELVEALEQPQLNDNQKLALEVLKIEYEDRGNCAAAIYWALEDDSLPNINNKDLILILQVFLTWALEQEE